jgi:hypothetical protein
MMMAMTRYTEVSVHLDGGVGVDVDCLGAIDERHASSAPPAQHPTEVLEENVPGRGDTLLAFHARVAVQPVRVHHDPHAVRYSAKILESAGELLHYITMVPSLVCFHHACRHAHQPSHRHVQQDI